MNCETCPNAEWDCVDGHWYIYGCMGECEKDEAREEDYVLPDMRKEVKK